MISVVIPVYKKTKMFLRNLERNLPHLKGYETIIVNDYPDESIAKYLEKFPVTLIENKRNLGFGGAVNVGVEKAKNRYVILLNSDVVLGKNDFELAINHFKKNNKLFAVGFAQKERNGSIVGRNKIFWSKGFLQHKAGEAKQGINAWAEGGASMLDKEKFNKLGGFDDIYSPFYWEDIDLSYRAWRSGYEIIFEPKVLVSHFHESTIGNYFARKEIKTIAYRNQFLFVWKNIDDFSLLFNHLLWLIPNLLADVLRRDLLTRGFLQALPNFLQALSAKRRQSKLNVYSDQDIINKFHE